MKRSSFESPSGKRSQISQIVVAWALLGLLGAPGCASWVALSMPGPANDQQIVVDMRRSEVENALAVAPSSIDEDGGMLTAQYEYADGPPTWSKLRTLVYLTADVFTFFLSELIFWPIEIYVDDESKRTAVAHYSKDQKLASWTIHRKSSGEMLSKKRSRRYEQYAREAKDGSSFSVGRDSTRPRVSIPLPSIRTAQDVVLAPDSISTQQEHVEFEVVIRDAIRYRGLLVDGRPVVPASDGTLLVSQSVPLGESSILLTAIDESGAGYSQLVRVMRSLPEIDNPLSLQLGTYHALVIGNDNYQNLQPLETAVADARAVADLLRDRYGYEVELMIDASRARIVSTLASYRTRLGPRDNLLVYYAGHGVRDDAEDHGYWLPVDAKPDDPAQWIANARIVRQVKAMEAKHVIVIADSCFSGTLTRGIRVSDRAPGYLARLAQRRSRTALTSGGLEPVSDHGSGSNSVFAHALLQELRSNDGLLEANRLFMNVRRRVALGTRQRPEYAPIVSAGHEEGEFLFVARSR